jgi:hypothetical protein
MAFGLVCSVELFQVLAEDDVAGSWVQNTEPLQSTSSAISLRGPVASTSIQPLSDTSLPPQSAHGWPGRPIPANSALTAPYLPLPPRVVLPENLAAQQLPTVGFGRSRHDLLAGSGTVDAHVVDFKGERHIMFVFGVCFHLRYLQALLRTNHDIDRILPLEKRVFSLSTIVSTTFRTWLRVRLLTRLQRVVDHLSKYTLQRITLALKPPQS